MRSRVEETISEKTLAILQLDRFGKRSVPNENDSAFARRRNGIGQGVERISGRTVSAGRSSRTRLGNDD
ncbi:MAG: hypothetical protein O3B13_07170 [Planctomycetota bacterium]|nr:hypothetical protein [Planctomycetota bacterium]